MHVVIAPDKFKGSLTAVEAAEHLARPFRAAGHRVTLVPMADGGEGTVEAALASGHTAVPLRVTGPLGTPVEAQYAFDPATATAVIEMALASGLSMTRATDDHARRATSRGTGELIVHALNAGARRVILGVGGSASTDGGAGMMTALGARLYDRYGGELGAGGAELARLARIDLAELHPRVGETEFILAADVDNPLLGQTGAAAVYGPQKGAAPHTVKDLDAALALWDQLLIDSGAASAEDAATPGAGAAGGVGYAAIALLGAQRRAGIDVVLDLTDFAERVAGATVVITGEGSLDEQSLHGKTPIGVAQAAARAGATAIAVAGRSTLTADQARSGGIERCYQILDLEPDREVAMRDAGRLLEALGQRIAEEYEREQ